MNTEHNRKYRKIQVLDFKPHPQLVPILVISALSLLIALFAVCESPEISASESGYEEEIFWEISDDILYISGDQSMRDFSPLDRPQWELSPLFSKVTTIVIEDGVKSIGAYAFYGNKAPITFTIINSPVSSIGQRQFYSGANHEIVFVSAAVPSIKNASPFENVKSIRIPTDKLTDYLRQWGPYHAESWYSLIESYDMAFAIKTQVFSHLSIGFSVPAVVESEIPRIEYVTQISWSTDDASIATVDSHGMLYGKKEGTVTIHASCTLTGGKSYSATCAVEVYPALDGDIKWKISGDTLTLEVGGGAGDMRGYPVTPPVMSDDIPYWEQCAEYSSVSKIIVSGGIISIGAAAFYQNDAVRPWNKNIELIIIPDSIRIIGSNAFGYSDADIYFISDSEAIPSYIDDSAFVQIAGNVYVPLDSREAYIEAIDVDSEKLKGYSFEIGFDLDDFKRIYSGYTAQMHMTIKPSVFEQITTITEWSSSDEEVAAVDSDGFIRGVSEGVAAITINYYYAGTIGSIDYNIEVLDSVDGGNISWEIAGDTLNLNLVPRSSDTDMRDFQIDDIKPDTIPSWELCDEYANVKRVIIGDGITNIGIAAFDQDNSRRPWNLNLTEIVISSSVTKVKNYPFNFSNADIYFLGDTSPDFDGDAFTNSQGNIHVLASSIEEYKEKIGTAVEEGRIVGYGNEISIDYTVAEIELGRTMKLTPNIPIPGAIVEFSSSNVSVAKVDSHGTVTAIGNGKATIFVKASYGGDTYECSCAVTVKNTEMLLTSVPQLIMIAVLALIGFFCARRNKML